MTFTSLEIRWLELLANGSGRDETMRVLGIDDATRHQMMAACRFKLKAKSLPHMAAIAVSYGLVQVRE